ncbi:MAG: cytochrome c biogenesis protein CcdA [Oscillospiraceae bacterium]|nr:cytochrome c biogenesis protein CcdA [Oscillospiraceae bacterium]
MVYLLTFTEGVLAFLSPCVLPLLPAYVSYFAAGEAEPRRTAKNALGFFLGFTLVFVALGVFAGLLGSRLPGRTMEIFAGGLLIFFGLHYIGALRLPGLSNVRGVGMDAERLRSLSLPWAIVFGATFALIWTPCVGVLLGAALLKATLAGGAVEGGFLLFLFALGMGLPFVLSALLIDQLKGAFQFVKRHYTAINLVSGGLLILMGAAMVLGLFGQLMQRIL